MGSRQNTKHNSMTGVRGRICIGIMVRERRVQNIKSRDESGAGDGPQNHGGGRPWTLTSSLTFGVFTEEV